MTLSFAPKHSSDRTFCILSSATTALSTLCRGRLYPHIHLYMYIYILRHLLEILNMDRNIKTMHCKRFESFCSSMRSKKTHLIFCFVYQCLVQIQKNSLCLLAHVEKLLLYLKVNSFWETFVDDCLIWNYTHQYHRHNQRWKWYLEHKHVSVGLLKSAYSWCYCLLSRTCYNTMELSLFLLETFCIGNWFIPWICGIWSRWALLCIAIMCSTLTFSLNFVLQFIFLYVSCEMTGYGKRIYFFHYFEFSCGLSKCHLYCGVSQRGPTQWLGQSCSSPASLFPSVSDYSEVTQPNYDINLAILFYS